MRATFRRSVRAGVLAVGLALTCGVAVAAAQSVPVILGAVANPTAGNYEDSLSGAVAVAAQDTSQGWYAYAPSYYNGDLTAISMANPSNPTIVGEGAPSGGPTQLYGASTINIFGGVAYVVSKNLNQSCPGASSTPPNLTGCSNDNGEGNALTLFNISPTSPAAPQFLGSIADAATPQNNLFGAYGVTGTSIGGVNYAVVAAQGCLAGQPCPDTTVGNDLAMISVASPGSPQYVGSISNTTAAGQGWSNALDHPTAVAVSGNYAYVTSFYGNALTIVDISNPASPQVAAEIRNSTDFPAPSDVAIQGNYAYVANQNSSGNVGTFTVVDIANPLIPTVVGTVNAVGLSGGYRVRVSGNTAYVAAHASNAITNVDITNPADPIVVGSAASQADLFGASGLDLMSISGNQYVVASSPDQPSDGSYIYPPYPSFGNTAQTSNGTITALELEDLPVNTSPPTVTGSTVVGATLTANVGTWTGSPVSYAYQWQRCDTQGANCTVLKTVTQTYPLSSNDLGHTLRVAVKASTSSTSATATSAVTAVVTAATPVPVACPTGANVPAGCALPKVSVRPTVTGTMKAGQRLVSKPGTWSALPASTYGSAQAATTKVQWLRCNGQGAGCQAIKGATQLTYRLTNTDAKRRLKLEVIATNRNGSTTAMSALSPRIASSKTKITLALKMSPKQRLGGRGYAIASVRSNVGALLDLSVAIRIGNSTQAVTGTPVQARPGAPLSFKVVLKTVERTRLLRALAAHRSVSVKVSGVRYVTPGRSALQRTTPQKLTVTG